MPTDDRLAAAKRLRRYLLDLFAENGGDGGVNGLADATGVKRQQMYEWFSASVEPNMGSLDKLARGLKTTRAEIVAAMDGQLPPPNWRRELESAIAAAPIGEPSALGERVLASLMAREARDGVTDDELAEAQIRAAAFLAVALERRPRPEGDDGGGAADA